MAWLVLPEAETSTSMACNCWFGAHADLSIIVVSELGMRLVGSGLMSARSEILLQRADDSLSALLDACGVFAESARQPNNDLL